LKQRIRAGENLFGFSAPISIEPEPFQRIVEPGNYDFVFVDSQHVPFSENALVAFCAMAEEFDLPVHLRIKHTRNAYLIGNYLDLGPSGIEVPQVELETTVEESIAGFYYPPRGNRSFGGGARRGATEHPDPPEYARWWNEYGVLWMQVESVAAVEKAYCLARPGVDCFSFGPTDLSFSLEHGPHPRLKNVDDCVQHVAEVVQDTGVAVCFRNGTPENRQKYADMGVTVFLEQPPAV